LRSFFRNCALYRSVRLNLRGMPNAQPTVTLTTDERSALVALRTEARGISRASGLVGVSRDTYERAAGGLPIRRGSAALVRTALARTDAIDAMGNSNL
jgi:hypothetical protein